MEKTMISLLVGIAGAVASAWTTFALLSRVSSKNSNDKPRDDKYEYDRDGYDPEGFNRYGYDRDGYDRNGFNVFGFNEEGYDVHGYDRLGYDYRGYGKDGYDRYGYDEYGYDEYGYDRDGLNDNGYYRSGYNTEGVDAAGNTSFSYCRKVSEMDEVLAVAANTLRTRMTRSLDNNTLKACNIPYCIRSGVSSIIAHWLGSESVEEEFKDNVSLCTEQKLISKELGNRLTRTAELFADDKVWLDKMRDRNNLCMAFESLKGVRDQVNAFAMSI
jgi:hypothetical protein